jgi:hypothetical protein
MTTRTQLRRVERAEQAAKTQLRFSPECLCFPDDERPEFRWQVEAEIAARVLCPLHGLRFKVVLTRFLYRAARFYSSDMQAGCPNRSEVYQRAMRVSFDTNLWPANEEDAPGADALLGCVLVLRDGGGKRFIAPKAEPSALIGSGTCRGALWRLFTLCVAEFCGRGKPYLSRLTFEGACAKFSQ